MAAISHAITKRGPVMAHQHKTVIAWFHAASVKLLYFCAALSLLLMMVVTFADVVCRYVFSAPIFGSVEIISILFSIVIFSGLGIANSRDDHISVELVSDVIRDISPRGYNLIINLFSIFVMILLFYVILHQTLTDLKFHNETLVIQLPLVYISGAMAALTMMSLMIQVCTLYINNNHNEK